MNRLTKHILVAKTQDLVLAGDIDGNLSGEDPFKKERILLDDLEFTLRRDPTRYLRPRVIFNDNKLEVVGNTPFFQGIERAQIEKVYIDLYCKYQVELSRVMQRFNLKSTPQPRPVTSFKQFLFYSEGIPSIDTAKIRRRCPLIKELEVVYDHNHVNFTIPKGSREIRKATERAFLDEYAIGQLRSIGGIVRPAKRYEKYFTSPQVG